MSDAVVGITADIAHTERVASRLRSEGFREDQISLVAPDTRGNKDISHENKSKAPEGIAVGASSGALLGGALGWLTGLGAVAFPGLGPFILAGPAVAVLTGMGVGSAAGGVIGGLVGLGIPEYEAKLYEERLREGRILLAAHPETDEQKDRAEKVMKEMDAKDVACVSLASSK